MVQYSKRVVSGNIDGEVTALKWDNRVSHVWTV